MKKRTQFCCQALSADYSRPKKKMPFGSTDRGYGWRTAMQDQNLARVRVRGRARVRVRVRVRVGVSVYPCVCREGAYRRTCGDGKTHTTMKSTEHRVYMEAVNVSAA